MMKSQLLVCDIVTSYLHLRSYKKLEQLFHLTITKKKGVIKRQAI